MPIPMKPLRRIVTGQNSGGRSVVLYDSAAPNVNVGGVASSAGMTDIWAFPHCPVPLGETRDDGAGPFRFDPPALGGHLRVVHSAERPANYDPAARAHPRYGGRGTGRRRHRRATRHAACMEQPFRSPRRAGNFVA